MERRGLADVIRPFATAGLDFDQWFLELNQVSGIGFHQPPPDGMPVAWYPAGPKAGAREVAAEGPAALPCDLCASSAPRASPGGSYRVRLGDVPLCDRGPGFLLKAPSFKLLLPRKGGFTRIKVSPTGCLAPHRPQ